MEKSILNLEQFCSFFDVKDRTVRDWIENRGLPVCRPAGGNRGFTYFILKDVENWLRSTSMVGEGGSK